MRQAKESTAQVITREHITNSAHTGPSNARLAALQSFSASRIVQILVAKTIATLKGI